jgi:transcription-repair coupling factor (superfamily II helicase)
VRNLIAVAAFRQRCRAAGVTEVALTNAAGSAIKVGPVDLQDSGQLRLNRLYPGSTYKPSLRQVVVRRPSGGAADAPNAAGPRRMGPRRMGAGPLRDTALLDWCARLVTDLTEAPAAVAR